MSKDIGILIVFDPTNRFKKWLINQKGYRYSTEKHRVFQHQTTKITIYNYRLGSYEGIVGNGAKFNGIPI